IGRIGLALEMHAVDVQVVAGRNPASSVPASGGARASTLPTPGPLGTTAPAAGPSIERPQLVLGRLQPGPTPLRQLLARAIDVEREHRHGGAIGIRLPPLAVFRRAL